MTALSQFDSATDLGQPYPDEHDADRAWDRRVDVLVSIDTRLERITELVESMRYVLGRDDLIALDDLLALYDKTNAVIAEAIAEYLVEDDEGYLATFAQFDALTKPAIVDDEMVLSASEYSKDLDDSYDIGYEDGRERGVILGFDEGIDAGIKMTSRVLQALDARLVGVNQLRD